MNNLSLGDSKNDVLNDSALSSDESLRSVKEIDLMNLDKPKILVVNDNFPLLNMLADMLEDCFSVRTADNGLEALDVVLAHPRNYFDVIVLDINMPIMDGFETCDKINKYLASTGVIQMVETNKEENKASLFYESSNEKSPFALQEETKREVKPVKAEQTEGW